MQDAVSQPVSVAFQLGWDMTRLYRVAAKNRPMEFQDPQALPSQRDFGGPRNTERRLAAVSAGLHRLADALAEAGLESPSVAALQGKYKRGNEKRTLREAVYRLHVQTLITMQAADPRLGSSYNLGRALAELITPQDDPKALKTAFSQDRIRGLRSELDQLAASFPEHSAKAVSKSLCVWQSTLAATLKRGGTPPQALAAALPRQAEVWRGLLSGERIATDRLSNDDYVAAAKLLVDEASGVVRSVLGSYWRELLAALVVLIAGVAFAFIAGGAAGVVAGIGAAASALGISWKGIGTTLSGLADHLRGPLWKAELEGSIAHEITVHEVHDRYLQLAPEDQVCGGAVTPPPMSEKPGLGKRISRGLVGDRFRNPQTSATNPGSGARAAPKAAGAGRGSPPDRSPPAAQ